MKSQTIPISCLYRNRASFLQQQQQRTPMGILRVTNHLLCFLPTKLIRRLAATTTLLVSLSIIISPRVGRSVFKACQDKDRLMRWTQYKSRMLTITVITFIGGNQSMRNNNLEWITIIILVVQIAMRITTTIRLLRGIASAITPLNTVETTIFTISAMSPSHLGRRIPIKGVFHRYRVRRACYSTDLIWRTQCIWYSAKCNRFRICSIIRCIIVIPNKH